MTVLVMAVGLTLVAAPALAATQWPDWTKQFGSAGADVAKGVAVDPAGGVLVVGHTAGSITGWPARGGYDAFIRKIKANGKKAWTKQFGTTNHDYATSVATDGAGRIYVAGYTYGSLQGTNTGSRDAFVRKIKPDGKKAWTRQFGTTTTEYAYGVTVDRSGKIYVVGQTFGSLKGANSGSGDVYVRKYRPDGTSAWTRQFGTTNNDVAYGVATDRSGNVYVVGSTTGSLQGTNKGSTDAFVRKYKPNGSAAWTRQFGTTSGDDASDVAVDSAGNVYVVGTTYGSLKGANKGDCDAFVRKYRSNGTSAWIRQFGTVSRDYADGVAVDGVGKVYVAGRTDGSLKGTNQGSADAFVRAYKPSGVTAWTDQIGSAQYDSASGVASDPGLRIVVSGFTDGSVTGWPSRGGIDSFVRKYRR